VDESPSGTTRRLVNAMDCVLAADLADGRDIWSMGPEGQLKRPDSGYFMHSMPDTDNVFIGTLSTISKPPELIDEKYS